MASLRKRGRVWYYRFTDADGVKIERKGCPDKRATEAMAAHAEAEAARVRSGLADRKAETLRSHEAKPLAAHLADWRQDMEDRGTTAKHAELSFERAGKLIALANGARLDELEPGRKPEALERAASKLADALSSARLSDLTPEKIQSALALLRSVGKSNQTANHYRAAIRAFVRWAGDKGRLRDDPMRGVRGFNAEEDVRHERRTLTDDELARLIRAAESGPELFDMPGPLRAMAYRVAAATGFRAEELRTLTPESFRTKGPSRPSISRPARRRTADRPISRSPFRWPGPWPTGWAGSLRAHRSSRSITRRPRPSAPTWRPPASPTRPTRGWPTSTRSGRTTSRPWSGRGHRSRKSRPSHATPSPRRPSSITPR
jgi:hypothetical protein